MYPYPKKKNDISSETDTLIEVKQSDDGKSFDIKGVAPGIAHVTVSQNINGVMTTIPRSPRV